MLKLFTVIFFFLSLLASVTCEEILHPPVGIQIVVAGWWKSISSGTTRVKNEGFNAQTANVGVTEESPNVTIFGYKYLVKHEDKVIHTIDDKLPRVRSFDLTDLLKDRKAEVEKEVKAEKEANEKEEAKEAAQKKEDLEKGIYDREGGFRIGFSKKSITIGDVGLDKIFKAIRDACKPAGTCVTDDIDIKGQFLGKGLTSEVDNIKVTLKPGGSYREVHHDKLLELLEAAVRKVAKCEQYTHKSPCSFTQGYCPNQEKTVTTCKTPSYWSVNLQTEKEAKHDSAPPTIEVNVSMKVVDDTICEDVFGKLEEFGGAISGRAGTTLSLWKYACL